VLAPSAFHPQLLLLLFKLLHSASRSPFFPHPDFAGCQTQPHLLHSHASLLAILPANNPKWTVHVRGSSMTMAAQQAAGTLGTMTAWLWGDTELSDMTLLLATKGGCDLGLLLCDCLLLGCVCCRHCIQRSSQPCKRGAEWCACIQGTVGLTGH
jgi:hypothetical protein